MTHPHSPQINCPIVSPNAVTPCPPEELDPLLAWLGKGERPFEQLTFPRGTALPDGRLDLCKQSLGIEGARRVCASLTEQPGGVRHLLLGTNGLGNEGAEALAQLIEVADSLTTVYLGCNGIGESGVAALSEVIADSSHVQSLWLKRNPLGVGGARHLAEMLYHNRGLKTLDLTNTELGEEGLAVLCEGLTAQEAGLSIKRLYLGGNGIGKAGAERLAAWLASSPALEELYLSVNRLGDAGTAALAVGLRHAQLRVLSLASNRISAVWLEALLDGLPPTLRRLDLGHARGTIALGEHPNYLGDEGAAKIAAWLATNPGLQALDLGGNKLISKAGLALEAALAHNTHLIELKLGGHISRKIRRRIRALLERNLSTVTAPQPPPELLHIRSVYRTK